MFDQGWYVYQPLLKVVIKVEQAGWAIKLDLACASNWIKSDSSSTLVHAWCVMITHAFDASTYPSVNHIAYDVHELDQAWSKLVHLYWFKFDASSTLINHSSMISCMLHQVRSTLDIHHDQPRWLRWLVNLGQANCEQHWYQASTRLMSTMITYDINTDQVGQLDHDQAWYQAWSPSLGIFKRV